MKGAKAFSDMSTAPADEKVRRFLEALTDREHPKYFHDDGFPRRFLAEDAEAALFWFNFILAENKRQCAVLKMVQEALGSNGLGEGRERGILREASSGEAATSTDGLEPSGNNGDRI